MESEGSISSSSLFLSDTLRCCRSGRRPHGRWLMCQGQRRSSSPASPEQAQSSNESESEELTNRDHINIICERFSPVTVDPAAVRELSVARRADVGQTAGRSCQRPWVPVNGTDTTRGDGVSQTVTSKCAQLRICLIGPNWGPLNTPQTPYSSLPCINVSQ
ncbi:hypothetical protein F2P81_015780 [Scophthalmus maximus]|uniref:Uncharacterized protein n=1 Tax=Scophthalmus maximus TaxID=52904 RepID=A0A6A4SF89_SCOMX|nr:hypothetical protein F2P81_015780 [Scophthalmus maximus]